MLDFEKVENACAGEVAEVLFAHILENGVNFRSDADLLEFVIDRSPAMKENAEYIVICYENLERIMRKSLNLLKIKMAEKAC